MSYASQTTVPVDRTKAEIEQVLTRFGATKFAYMSGSERAAIAFEYQRWAIRMELVIPTLDEFTRTPTGKTRPKGERETFRDRAIRSRWRELLLIIKAKLVSVDAGILTFQSEFLPYLVVEGGQTVAQKLLPQIEAAAESGKMPTLLLGMDT